MIWLKPTPWCRHHQQACAGDWAWWSSSSGGASRGQAAWCHALSLWPGNIKSTHPHLEATSMYEHMSAFRQVASIILQLKYDAFFFFQQAKWRMPKNSRHLYSHGKFFRKKKRCLLGTLSKILKNVITISSDFSAFSLMSFIRENKSLMARCDSSKAWVPSSPTLVCPRTTVLMLSSSFLHLK